MDEARISRVLLALAASDGAPNVRLCAASIGVLALSGAGITLMTGDRAARTTLCASDLTSRRLEELQFALGEGPCFDAFAGDRPVMEEDLAAAAPPRWPAFSPAALLAGAAAVFCFPLRADETPLGTLNFYRDRPGPLSSAQLLDALVVADVVGRQIVGIQAGAAPGALARGLLDEPGSRTVIHQATGMVAAQLDVQLHESLLRLKARALATGVALEAVARAVVTRQLRFEADGGASWASGGDLEER